MTLDEIRVNLAPLVTALQKTGRTKVDVSFRVEANVERLLLQMSWAKPITELGREWDKDYETIMEATAEDAFMSAHVFIANLMPIEEVRILKFNEQLGKLIDKGNELGISVDHLNPLTETMKRISENALTFGEGKKVK